MLQQRRFNVVLVNKDTPKTLNMENPQGMLIEYNGGEVKVSL